MTNTPNVGEAGEGQLLQLSVGTGSSTPDGCQPTATSLETSPQVMSPQKQTRQPNHCAKTLSASSYPMHCKPHGKAIIIGIDHFKTDPQRPMLNLPDRHGTNIDMECFSTTFIKLGYEKECYRNCTADVIKDVVHRAMAVNHTTYDSFVLCVSTYVERNHFIFGSDCHTVDVYELVRMIQLCPTLAGKPKMLFVQACHVQPHDQQVILGDGPTPPIHQYPGTDLFIAWAPTRINPAYESPMYGCLFAMALYVILTKRAYDQDLVSMMCGVNNLICSMEGVVEGTSGQVHQCVMTVQLRHSIKFFHSSP